MSRSAGGCAEGLRTPMDGWVAAGWFRFAPGLVAAASRMLQRRRQQAPRVLGCSNRSQPPAAHAGCGLAGALGQRVGWPKGFRNVRVHGRWWLEVADGRAR